MSTRERRLVFPQHGHFVARDKNPALLFPFLRAVWDRMSNSADPLPVEKAYRMTFFQKSFVRILSVLREIARCERLILSNGMRDGAPPNQWVPVYKAREQAPMFLDLFFFYFRMLADRFTEALGPLVSEKPGSFPAQYNSLAGAASGGSLPRQWSVRRDCGVLAEVVRNHSVWYRILSGPIAGSGNSKGVRDAICHRLSEFSISTVHAEVEDKPICMSIRIDGADNDIPRVDALELVPRIIAGFCDLLSALPTAIWVVKDYEKRDTFLNGAISAEALVRFFPQLDIQSQSDQHNVVQ